MGDRGAAAVAYLPAFLVRAAADEATAALPWHREVDGTMVMADLSGFTALSERLAKLGDEGAERLTVIINSFFERMLATATRYGGDTLTFGGDAILLLFEGSGHAARAAAAALEMLKRVERAGAIDAGDGKVKIGMSVGAHSDRFLLAGVGLADERAHLVVLGRGGEQTALAEAQAERGRLAVSPSCRESLPADVLLTPAGACWQVMECDARVVATPASESPAFFAGHLSRLVPFMPPYARAAPGGEEVLRMSPEHRRAVIVFVNVLGVNELIVREGVAGAVEQFQSYCAILTRLATKHAGFVVSSDIATRGSKLIVAFGVPLAHEYAAANAARFALDLSSELRASGLELEHKIGLNSGHVFAGEVGPAFRRQYTVMGDAVNLAARLMAASRPGQALASRRLVDRAGRGLCSRELEPVTVKGKTQPVAVCVLEQGASAEPEAKGPRQPRPRLFGRRRELDEIARLWEGACRGAGRSLLIEGEAGVGKTRLLEEAIEAMVPVGRVTRAACFEHLQAAPFAPWMEALPAVLDIEGDDKPQRTAKVQEFLTDRLGEAAEFGALLNPLLDLSLLQGPLVGSLDAQSRRRKLFELVTTVLIEAGRDDGHMVVVEDVHWMDESSLALTDFAVRHMAAAPVLIVLTARPTESLETLERAGASRMTLSELTEVESLTMVSEALGTDLPAAVGEAIYAKTRGNPLFLEEVVHALQSPGVLEGILSASSVKRAGQLAALEIPDRVQGLLMSRIDRLAPDTREVLKVGAVVGRSFDRQVLDGIADPLLRAVSLPRAFDELQAAALVVGADVGAASGVTFRHALVQDVAYESLPFARRRDLHGRVARYLEGTEQSSDHALLLHHYLHAGNAEQTRHHAVRASESSVAVYANLEAIDYLAVALETATRRTPIDACIRSRLEELTGDSLATLSRHEEAVACYIRARRRWASSSVRRIAGEALDGLAPIGDTESRESLLSWKIAVSVERGRAAYKRALRWLDGAADAPHDRRLEARVVITRGGVLSRLGRYREAAEFGERGLALARDHGDAGLQAYAATLLGVAFSGLGLLRRAIDCDSEAVGLYERAGDLVGLALSQSNLGAGYMAVGELAVAREWVEKALGLQARIGDRNGVAVQQLNLGAVLLQMGDVEEAAGHLEEAQRLRADASPVTTGYGLVFLAQAHTLLGDLERAQEALSEGTAILSGIDAGMFLLDAGIAGAELALARSDLARARADCSAAISQARSMGAELAEAQARCLQGRVLLAQGEPEAAIPGLVTCVALTEKIGSDYERARALAVLAEARASCTPNDRACSDELGEAVRLFRKMGARLDLERAEQVRQRLESARAAAD